LSLLFLFFITPCASNHRSIELNYFILQYQTHTQRERIKNNGATGAFKNIFINAAFQPLVLGILFLHHISMLAFNLIGCICLFYKLESHYRTDPILLEREKEG
jgi:hypothetical protein